jgi:hypothetical protein
VEKLKFSSEFIFSGKMKFGLDSFIFFQISMIWVILKLGQNSIPNRFGEEFM